MEVGARLSTSARWERTYVDSSYQNLRVLWVAIQVFEFYRVLVEVRRIGRRIVAAARALGIHVHVRQQKIAPAESLHTAATVAGARHKPYKATPTADP